MESELFSIVSSYPYSMHIKTDADREAVVYLVNKCIQHKDIKKTGAYPSEIFGALGKKGYSRAEVHASLDDLEIMVLPMRWGQGEDFNTRMLFLGGIAQRIAREYLGRHPEIKDVKDPDA